MSKTHLTFEQIKKDILLCPRFIDHNKNKYITIIDDVIKNLKSASENSDYNDKCIWVNFVEQVINRENEFKKQCKHHECNHVCNTRCKHVCDAKCIHLRDTNYSNKCLDCDIHPLISIMVNILYSSSYPYYELEFEIKYDVLNEYNKLIEYLSCFISYINIIDDKDKIIFKFKYRLNEYFTIILNNIKFKENIFNLMKTYLNYIKRKKYTLIDISIFESQRTFKWFINELIEQLEDYQFQLKSKIHVSWVFKTLDESANHQFNSDNSWNCTIGDLVVKEYLMTDYRAAQYFNKKKLFQSTFLELHKQIKNKDSWIEIIPGLYHIPSLPDPEDFIYSLKTDKTSSAKKTYCEAAKF